MVLLETFVDDFSTDKTAQWVNTSSVVNLNGGSVNIEVTAADQYEGRIGLVMYELAGSRIRIQIPNISSTTNSETTVRLTRNTSNANDEVAFYINNGVCHGYYSISGVQTNGTSQSWPGNGTWIEIAESGGTITMRVANNFAMSSASTIYTVATATACPQGTMRFVSLVHGRFAGGTSSASFDNQNVDGTANVPSLQDGGSVSMALSVAISLIKSLTDTGSAVDSFINGQATPKSLADSGSATDTVKVSAATQTESGSSSDSVSVSGAIALAEAGSAVETLFSGNNFIADAGSATETLLVPNVNVSFADNGLCSDSLSANANTFFPQLFDAGSASEINRAGGPRTLPATLGTCSDKLVVTTALPSGPPIFDGFSIQEAIILTGVGFADDPFYGVESAAFTVDTGSFDLNADDVPIGQQNWINSVEITVTGGYIPFTLLQTMYGSAVTSSGTSPNDYYSVPLWAADGLNRLSFPVLLKVQARRAGSNTLRVLQLILYRVRFDAMQLTGPVYKDGLKCSWRGKAFLSSFDEQGNALAEPAYGRAFDGAFAPTIPPTVKFLKETGFCGVVPFLIAERPPAVVTGAAQSVTDAAAVITATVNPHGFATTWQFELGTTTSYGGLWPFTAGDAGSQNVDVPVNVLVNLGLSPSTTYHYRIVAHNAFGTVQGSDATFTTLAAAPTGVVTTYDDKAAFEYSTSPSWSSAVDIVKYGGDEHFTSNANATATAKIAITGGAGGFKAYGAKASHHGIMTVTIDGGAQTDIDCYSATRIEDALLWTSPLLSVGEHTIIFNCALRHNPSSTDFVVALDKVDVIDGTVTQPNSPPPPNGFVFDDEGTGSAGQALDPTKWTYDVGGNGWGNNEIQSYTSRTTNSGYDGAGNIYVRAQRETYADPSDNITRQYTSARIVTRGKFSFGPGYYVEMRAIAATANGTWGGYWTLAQNGVWPPEIDGAEIAADSGHNYVHTNLHLTPTDTDIGWTYPGAPNPSDLGTAYHRYGFYADNNKVDWYFDGVKIRTYLRSSLPGGVGWVFDQGDIYLLINLAIGSAGGDPSGTSFPQQWTVDYIRVSQGEPGAVSPPPTGSTGKIELGVVFTSNRPVSPFSEWPQSVVDGLAPCISTAEQQMFNYGGTWGDHRTFQRNGRWVWEGNDLTTTYTRFHAMQRMGIAPDKMICALHGAPVWCTEAADFDYASTAFVAPVDDSLHRTWLADWAEDVYNYLHSTFGLTNLVYYNEMKGYYRNDLGDWDWARYMRDYNAIYDRVTPLGAQLGGPYLIIIPEQGFDGGSVANWTSEYTNGPWHIPQILSNGVNTFLNNAHGYATFVLDASMESAGHGYFEEMTRWARNVLNARGKPHMPIIYAEFYGDMGNFTGSYTDICTRMYNAAAGDVWPQIWQESNDIAPLMVDDSGNRTAFGNENKQMRDAGVIAD